MKVHDFEMEMKDEHGCNSRGLDCTFVTLHEDCPEHALQLSLAGICIVQSIKTSIWDWGEGNNCFSQTRTERNPDPDVIQSGFCFRIGGL